MDIRIPSQVKKEFTFRQLLEFLIKEKDWITENQAFQLVLITIRDMMPEIIKIDRNKKLAIKYDELESILSNDPIYKYMERYIANFPQFEKSQASGEFKKEMILNTFIDVAHLKDGFSFGELALINDAPRSATITTLQNTDLATLEKENFQHIMAKVIRRKFAHMINFMSEFTIFNNMTRIALEKLALFMTKCEINLGHNLITEEDEADHIFFIKSGTFEISKYVYFEHLKEATQLKYLR